jgi:FixJ family two-component response regulator
MHEDNPCVFIVDDDRSTRESLRNLLCSMGLNVQTFASAHEFLTSQRPDVPSCLALDVQLSGLSGLDLQQELAKGNAPIPIIFVIGHGDIPMTVRAMKAGAIEFLTKPFRDEDLLNAIEQALHRGRQMASCKHTPAEETLYPADVQSPFPKGCVLWRNRPDWSGEPDRRAPVTGSASHPTRDGQRRLGHVLA